MSISEKSTDVASYWACEACGTWNSATAAKCRECGEAHGEGRDYNISFSLSFPAAECPRCGVPGPAGPCANCGEAVPAVDDPGQGPLARQRALESLVTRTAELVSRYDELPEAHIPIAADQYATAVVDSRALKRMRLSIRYPRNLSMLDLDDPQEIGGRVRAYVRRLCG